MDLIPHTPPRRVSTPVKVAAALTVALALTGAVYLTHGTPAAAADTAAPATSVNGITLCDPRMVTTHPDGRNGTAVLVNAPGPDVVSVSLIPMSGRRIHQVQQVTLRGTGARFDFGDSNPAYAVVVSTNKLGLCEAPIPEGNRNR